MKENDKDNSQNSPKNKNYLNLMKQNDESKEISRKRSSKKNIANEFSRYDIEEE